MDANGQKRISEVKNGFMKKGLMQKTVANLVTVFFIFSGIPAPVSLASVNNLANDGTPKNVATLTLAQANAKSVSASATLPSGVAIQTQSPLSQVQTSVTAYDPSQVTVLPHRPVVGSGVGSGGVVVSGTIQTVQPSSRNIQVQYSNLDSDDFAFVYLSSGTTMDLRNGINVGLNGVSGKKIKLELKDTAGNVASFYLTLQGTFQNYAVSGAILSSYFPQLDATRIKEVVFVIDRANMDATGTVEIETAGLSFTPVITNPTGQAVTDLSFLRPSVSSIEAVRGTTVTNFSQMSPDQFYFSYDLPAGGSQRWAASQIYFPNAQFGQPFNLAAVGGLVLNVSVQGASYYKLEFNDVNGMKVTIRVNVTNGSIFVPDVLLQSAGVVGFESSKIQSIVLVVDDPQATTGSVQVRTKGLLYTPIITGSFYSPSAITQLTNRPVLNASSSFTHGTIQLSQTSSHDFVFNYTLPSPSDFVFAYFGDGYFDYDDSNVWVGSTMNLTSGVTFAVNGPSGNQLKVEVTDKYGFRAIYYLALAGTLQNYTLNLQGMGIDAANVAQMVFTAEPSKMGSSGVVQVEIKGLSYTPVISATTPQPVTDLSSLRPSVSPIEPWPVATVSHFTQPSSNQFSFDYNFSFEDSSRWAAAQLFFPQDKLLDMGLNGLVLNVNLTGARYYKLEFMDDTGKKVVVRVNVIQGNVLVTSALLHSAEVEGFDPSRILGVVLVVDDPQASTGTVSVSTCGLAYTPVIAPSPELTSANVTTLREVRNLISIADPSGATAQVTQQSSSVYTLSYDMPRFGSWVVGLTAFDDYGTPQPVETQDLRGLGTLVMGLKLASGTGSIKIEFEDVNRNKGIVYLNNVGTTEQFYSIPISEVRESNLQLDLGQIVNINVVVEKYRVDQSSGQLQVRLGGHPYTPVVAGTPYTPGRITPIQNQPVLSSGSGWNEGHRGTISVSQGSPRHFSFNYALPDSGDYVFAYFGNGYFDGATWTGTSMDLSAGVTVGEMTPALEAGIEFAAKGPAGRKLKVEVIDVTGKRIVSYLDLSDSLQNYALRFSGRDIDPTKIAQIIFVAEQLKMGVSGVVEIETRGLAYTPVISSPTLQPLTVFSEQRPSAIAVEAVKGTTVVSFVQPSANEFHLSYNLAAGGLQRWAAGLILFPEGKTFDMRGSGIVLGVDLTGASYYKLEVEDVNGKKVTVRVALANGKVLVTDALLQSAEVAGFDSSRIHAIVVVVDDPSATTGQMKVSAQGMKYELPVPEGWTRAASNANFALKVEMAADYPQHSFVLKVQNLLTGEIKTVGDAPVYGGQISLYDVSPDGSTVIYYAHTNTAMSGYVAYGVVAHIANSSQSISFPGILTGIGFEENGAVAVLDFQDRQIKVDIASLQIVPPSVPEGWTRAEGNVNFAFQTRTSGEPRPGRFIYSLYLKDLRTGSEVALDSFGEFTGVSSVGNKVYVSQDGNSVFYSRNVYGGVGFGDGWEVVLRSSTGSRAVLHGTLDNVQFLSATVAEVTMTAQSVQRSYNLELPTGSIVLPEGWTRAGSNSFYAFRETQAGSQLILTLMDLRTDAVLELGRADIGGAYPQHFDGYDVLSDGSAAIFGTTRVPYGSSTYVRQLGGSTQLTINGRVTSSTYDSVARVLRINLENTVPVNPSWTTRTVLVDINSFSSLTSIYAGNAYEVFQSDQSYYVLVEGHLEKVEGVNPVEGTVFVEAVRASHGLIYFHWKKGTKDIYQLYNMTYWYPEGFFVSITEQEYLQGAIPLVPEGWTRASANKSYAYQIIESLEVTPIGMVPVQTLMMMDLLTGNVSTVGAAHVYGNYDVFTNKIDVSPDGRLAVFEIASNYNGLRRVEIRSLSGANLSLSVPTERMALEKIEYNSSSLLLHVGADDNHSVGGVYKVDLATQEVIFTPNIPPLSVGQFQAGGCAVAEFHSDVTSTACVGLVGTPNGTVEIHSYNQRNNTGLTIYNAAQQQILSYSVASPARLDAITQLNVSSDGKYLVVSGPVNTVSVLSLIVPSSHQSVMIPQAAGSSTPWVGEVKFITATRILVTMDDGSHRQFYVDIGSTGQLTLTPRVATPTVTAGTPTSAGALTLNGAKAANTSIWYSMDGGVTYKQLVSASIYTTWSGTLTLPVGSTTILVQARMTVVASGVSTVISSTPASVGPIVYTAPTVATPTVTASAPTGAGVVTLTGTRAPGTSIWYSMDGGVTYKQLAYTSSSTSWSGKITLPVGSTTVLVQARKTVVISGVHTVLSSVAASVGPITYTAPIVATPTVTASAPTSAGVVTLTGTRATGTSIWYSMDGGVTYKQLAYSSSSTSWSGKITLPVGSSTVLVQARTTAVVSGVSTVLSSIPVSVGPITYTAPTVATPTVTASAPTSAGVVTLTGTRAAGTSIWYSMDGGVTYKQLAYTSSSTSWSGKITMPVGSTTVLVQARTTAVVSGASTVLSSIPVSVGPITYTAPVVAAPTVTAGVPTRTGVVRLSGTRAAGTSIWYSLDGGMTYKQLAYLSSSLSWSGSITVPVGSTTVLVQARATAIVSGVNTTLSSAPAQLTIVR